MVYMDSPQHAVTSFLTCIKSKMAAGVILKKKENVRNSAAIWDNFINFGMLVAKNSLQPPGMSFFGYNKIQDQIQDGGRPPSCPKNSKWHNSGATQDRDMMCSSVVGLSGTADLMVKFSVSENSRWQLADILDILK